VSERLTGTFGVWLARAVRVTSTSEARARSQPCQQADPPSRGTERQEGLHVPPMPCPSIRRIERRLGENATSFPPAPGYLCGEHDGHVLLFPNQRAARATPSQVVRLRRRHSPRRNFGPGEALLSSRRFDHLKLRHLGLDRQVI